MATPRAHARDLLGVVRLPLVFELVHHLFCRFAPPVASAKRSRAGGPRRVSCSWVSRHQQEEHDHDPTRAAHVDRFNRTYRSEVLDAHPFDNLDQVRQLTAEWLRTDDEERPHDTRGSETPRPTETPSRPECLLSKCRLDGGLTRERRLTRASARLPRRERRDFRRGSAKASGAEHPQTSPGVTRPDGSRAHVTRAVPDLDHPPRNCRSTRCMFSCSGFSEGSGSDS